MSTITQAGSTALTLKQIYEAAGKDYTGLAEFSDVSAYKGGTNDYVLHAHIEQSVFCTGLKPNTRVWPRFDGRDISNYVRPFPSFATGAVGSLLYGADLVTDASGSLNFFYKIPNDDTMKFKGFKHLLEVSDVKPPVNNGISSGKTGATTRCGQYYFAPSNKDGFTAGSISSATAGLALSELTADESKTIVTSTQVVADVPDYLSQTFTVAYGEGDGLNLSSVHLYFKSKPTSGNSNVTVQIRKVGKNGTPTTELVAQSKTLTTGFINVSTDGSLSTGFTFDDKPFLVNGNSYAITVIPVEQGNEFKLFTGVQDLADSETGQRAFFPPQVGTLFGSATGNKWEKLPKEALKFTLRNQLYDTTTTGTVVLENEDLEFLTLEQSTMVPRYKTTYNSGYQINEDVRGECLMDITYTSTAPALGDGLRNKVALDGKPVTTTIDGSNLDAHYGQGTIRKIISDDTVNKVLKVKADVAGKFTVSGNVYNSSGTKIGTSTAFTANTVTGKVALIEPGFGKLRLFDSTGTPTLGFKAGEFVRGQTFGATAKVKTVDDLRIDKFSLRTPFNTSKDTTLDWYIKGTSISGSVDSNWTSITGGQTVEFDKNQKKVYSASNSTDKTLLIKAELTTQNSKVTPEFNWHDATVSAETQRINHLSTNETSPAGDAEARYVSRIMDVSNPSSESPTERINIVSDAYLPQDSGVKMFIRVRNKDDSESLEDKDYVEMNQYSFYPKATSTLGNRDDKVRLYHRISANTDGDNFLGVSNTYRENTANNGVISYRSGDGSIHHGVDQAQLKIVYTRPDGKGTAHSPSISFVSVTSHRAPLTIS